MVALANQRALGIDPAKMNVNGGSIAVGHPFGMTGSRQVRVRVCRQETQREKKKRLFSVFRCVGV